MAHYARCTAVGGGASLVVSEWAAGTVARLSFGMFKRILAAAAMAMVEVIVE